MNGSSADEQPPSQTGGQLKGRVAIVTGAGSGLGQAIAVALGRESVSIVVNDVDTAAGTAVAQEIMDAGGEAMFHFADVSKSKDVRSMIDATMDRYKRIDIL